MSGSRLNYRTRILLLLMVAVLLLPVYGSWVDIHYAERQPNHKHIYLGRIDLNHHRSSESKDVVNLPDQDATSQPVVIVCIPGELIAATTAVPANLIFGLPEEFRSPKATFLPPPDHPPRI
jgi:hypothetical protein